MALGQSLKSTSVNSKGTANKPKTPESLLKLAKSDDKKIDQMISNSEKEKEKLKSSSTTHKIPAGVTDLDYDDNEGGPSSEYAPPSDSQITGTEGEVDNEYHSVQIKAFRRDLDAERKADEKRRKALKAREINRKGTYGSDSTRKGPTWFEGLDPKSFAETMRKYSTWWGARTDNETFGACMIEYGKNFTKADEDSLMSKGKGFLKEAGEVLAGAALGAAREAVTNVGLAISDQAQRLADNTVNALGVAIDKALSPILEPVAGFMKDVKETVYGAIEAGAKFMNDFYTKTLLGVNAETIKFEKLGTEPYIVATGKDLNDARSNGAAYAIQSKKVADSYKAIISEKVHNELKALVQSGKYGNLATEAGASVNDGNLYKLLDEGVLAEIIDEFFTEPLMKKDAQTNTLEGNFVASLQDPRSIDATTSYLAAPLTNGSNTPLTDIPTSSEVNSPAGIESVNATVDDGNSVLFFKETLEKAAADAGDLVWAAAKTLCSTGKVMEDKDVMALMDSTRNRFYVLDKVTDMFEKTTFGQHTMEVLRNNTPGQLLNKFMMSQDSSNLVAGEVLLAATYLVDPSKKTEHTWNGTYLSQVKNLHKSIFKSPSLIGGNITYVKNLCYFDEKVLEEYVLGGFRFNGNIDIHNLSMLEKGEVNVLSALMNFRAEESINDNNTYFNQVTGGDPGNPNTSDGFAPKPMWYGLKEESKLFGPENLISMFRVNKLIPSGEIDYFQNGLFHLFFVKPDLNLTQNCVSLMGFHNHPLIGEIITQLNYNNNQLASSWGENFPTPIYSHRGAHPYFSYMFSNLVKSTSIPDLNLDVKEGWENSFGGRTQFGTTTRKSYIGNDFSITFYDTKDLLLMNTITAWMKYIEIMKEGQGDCERKAGNKGTIDYLGALYYFVMEPDNHTIAHWGRYVGIFPTSAPWSTVKLEGSSVDIPEFSVNFKSEYHEANDPNILLDFNYIMRLPSYTGTAGSTAKEYTRYGELASIYTSTGRKSTNDPNLLGGPTRSENRAYVRMTPEKTQTSNGNKKDKWGFAFSNPFKFVLEFESDMKAADASGGLAEKVGMKRDQPNGETTDVELVLDEVSIQADETQYKEEDMVSFARIEPPDIYDSTAVITYYNTLGEKLSDKFGSGTKLGKNWEKASKDENDNAVIETRYRVKIINAFWHPESSATSFGKDQKAAQELVGGLLNAGSNAAGRVDMDSVRKAFNL